MGRRANNNMAMTVVGGGLVVTAASLTALGILALSEISGKQNDEENGVRAGQKQNRLQDEPLLLPLPPTSSPVYRPSSSPSESSAPSQNPSMSDSPSALPSSSPSASARPTQLPSSPPSLTTKPSNVPSLVPSFAPSAKPSTDPSSLPSASLIPTHAPTTRSPTNNPTESPIDLLSSFSSRSKPIGTFHLRLHWEPGFMWQESPDEAWFCMACAWCDVNIFDEKCELASYCDESMSLALIQCDPSNRKNKRWKWLATFTLAREVGGLLDFDSGLEGDQIQVFNTDLCLQRERRQVLLQQCNASIAEQRFLGFEEGGQAMELLPYPGTFKKQGVEYQRCLTQHHHPKQAERIYTENCRKARGSDTNMWSTY
ncbi:hypothetical protein ACHAWF_010268 [Thalassiosira exigua]